MRRTLIILLSVLLVGLVLMGVSFGAFVWTGSIPFRDDPNGGKVVVSEFSKSVLKYGPLVTVGGLYLSMAAIIGLGATGCVKLYRKFFAPKGGEQSPPQPAESRPA